MATLVQSIWDSDGGADPAAITITEPTEGNLLVAVVTERGGGSTANHVLTSITGWTHEISETTEQGDGSHRRSFSVFWKIAGASEGTTLTADDGTSNSKWLSFHEFSFDGAENQWILSQKATFNNGTAGDATSLATGTTASVTGTTFLELGFVIGRQGTVSVSDNDTTSWTNGLVAEFEQGISTNAMFHMMGYDGDDTTEEAKSSVATFANSNCYSANSGCNGAILVFSLISAAGGLSIPIAAYHYNQMGRL